MHLASDDMNDLRNAIRGSSIQRAYQCLLSYMNDLRRHFKARYPKYSVSGLYQGYLDMTYFAVVPPFFNRHGLKIPVVFNYEAFRFEVWLSGRNQQVHRSLWELFKKSTWPTYRVVAPGTGVDSIVECDMIETPHFSDLDALTATIEKKTTKFIDEMEKYLSRRGSK